LDQAKAIAMMRDGLGILTGFSLAIPQPESTGFGPVVAPDPGTAAHLISHLSQKIHPPYRLDVPSRQEALLHKLSRMGFRHANPEPAPLMSRSGVPLPGRRECYFGLVSQAFGLNFIARSHSPHEGQTSRCSLAKSDRILS
jgi:hypothetical protein